MAVGELNTFVKGMIKDIDPHYQDSASYRDANNVRIISHRSKTFTIENISGNSITTNPVPNTSDVLKIQFSDDSFSFGDSLIFTNLDIEFAYVDPSVSVAFSNTGIEAKVFNANFTDATNNSTATADYYSYTTLEQFHKDVAEWIRTEYDADNVPIKAASDGSYISVWYPHNTLTSYTLQLNNGASNEINVTAVDSAGNAVNNDKSFTGDTSSSTLIGASGQASTCANLFINSYYEFPDFLIVLTQFDLEGDQAGQIWKLEFDADGDTSTWTLFYNGLLNFNKERKNIVEGILESDCIEKIYFTDFNSDLRSMNLKDDNLFGISPDLLSVFPHIKLGKPILSKIHESGELLAGVYQYAYRLITSDGGISPISPFSQLIPITASSESAATSDGSHTYEGSQPGVLCGKGVGMKVTGIDTRYNRIQVIAIRHEVESFGTATSVDIIEDDIIVDETFEFIHTDYRRSETFTFDELLQNKNSWSVCKDIAVKDNRLFAGNLKNTRLSLDFDEKAKSYDTTGATYTTTINTDHTKFRYLDTDGYARNPSDASSSTNRATAKFVFGGESDGFYDSTKGGIRYTFHVEKYEIDKKDVATRAFDQYSSNRSAEYPPVRHFQKANPGEEAELAEHLNQQEYKYNKNEFFEGPKSPYYNDLLRGYQRGEIYRFGIVFYDKRGNPDFVRWVSDIKIPDHHEAHTTNYAGHYVNNYGYSSTQKTVLTTKVVQDGSSNRYYTGASSCTAGDYTSSASTAGTSHVKISVESTDGFPDTGFIKINDEILYYCGRATGYFVVSDTNGKGRGRHGTTAANHSAADHTVTQILRYDDETAEDWTIANTNTDGFSVSFNANPICEEGKLNNIFGQAIMPKFEVRLTEADREKISGYSIVRVERGPSDKTILTQGLLSQVFKYSYDKKNGYSGTQGIEFGNKMGPHPLPAFSKVELGPSSLTGKHGFDSGGSFGAKDDIVIPGVYTLDSPDHHFDHTDLNLNDSLNIDVKANLSPKIDQSGENAVSNYTDFNNYSGDSFNFDITVFNQAGDAQNLGPNHGCLGIVRNCSDPLSQAHDKWIKYYSSKETSNAAQIMSDGGTNTDPATLSDNSITPTGNGFDSAVARNIGTYHQQSINEIDSVGPGEEKSSTSNFTRNYINAVGGGRNTISPAFNVNKVTQNSHYVTDMFNVIAGSVNNNVPNWIEKHHNDGYQFGKEGTYGLANGCKTLLLNIPNRIFFSHDIDGKDPNTSGDTSNVVADNNGQSYYTPTLKPQNQFDIGDFKFKGKSDWKEAWQYDKKLVNIKRNVFTGTGTSGQPKGQLVNQYGGTSEADRANNRYISTAHFQPVFNNEELYRNVVGGGDVFVDMYAYSKIVQDSADWEKGVDDYSDCGGPNMQLSKAEDMYTCGLCFPVETSINVSLREGNCLAKEGYVRGSGVEEFIYNTAYSQQNNLKGFVVKPVDFCESTEHFPSTIAYSDVKLMGDSTQDAWMRWDFDAFHDLDQKYGDLTNLFIVRNDMYGIQESGVNRITVNPRAILPSGDGVSVNVTSSGANVIERHDYFSELYGSQHQHSLVIGENAAYWMDVNKRKMLKLGWTEEGQFGIYKLSDKKGMRNYFRDLLQGQTVHDMPLLSKGIHGVYDRSTDDIILTIDNSAYIDTGKVHNPIKTTICYNEAVNAYTSFYTFHPRNYLRFKNFFYSCAKSGTDSQSHYLWKHNDVNENGPKFYGDHQEFNFQVVLNDSPLDVKTFDNVILVAETEDNTLFDTAVFSSNTETAQTINGTDGHYRVREGRHIVPVRSTSATTRIRDTYMYAKFSHIGTLTSGSKKFNIFALYSKFRKSYR